MISVEPRCVDALCPGLEAAWRRLLAVSPGPTFQHEPECVRAWLRHAREGAEALLLLVREGGALLGIVPLMARDERRRGLFPFRRLSLLGAGRTDFGVVLAEECHMRTVVAAALEWLFSGEYRWETLRLDDLVEGHPAVPAARDWLRRHGLVHAATAGRYYHVDLQRPFAEVMAETSRRFVRKNVNLARNRLARAGAWRVAVDPAWPDARLLDEAARLHVARQAELDRPSLFADPRARAFLGELIAHHRRCGRLRSYWLVREHPIAYLLGFEAGGVFYAWSMAFDPEAAYFYPSRVLLHEILVDCHARGLRELSFMRGEADYKAKWTARSRANHRIVVRNPTAYGRALAALEGAWRRRRAR